MLRIRSLRAFERNPAYCPEPKTLNAKPYVTEAPHCADSGSWLRVQKRLKRTKPLSDGRL